MSIQINKTKWFCSPSANRRKFVLKGGFRVLAGLALMALCFSCPIVSSSDDDVVDSSTSNPVHVAFAGGGWRAHTGHSAWTMALLDDGNKTLDEVFSNVGTISSNSGGSWFSTMLMYSDEFVQAIEAKDAIATWDSTGWLGQQKQLFNGASCQSDSGYLYLNCVANHYLPGEDKYYWNKVVEEIIFRDYPLSDSLTLSGARETWAKDKPLLLAANMLTTEVVLNKIKVDVISDDSVYYHQWYEACLSPYTPILDSDDGGSCSGQSLTPDVTPVTFSSIPGSTGLKTPYFLPAAADSLKFNLGYTLDYTVEDAPTASATLANPVANDQVPVVIAAAASSAAAGFAASAVVSGHFDLSYIAEDEALSFQLNNSKAQFVNVSNKSNIDTLASRKIVRIADGGPTDNSGVAQLVNFLQINNQADSFSIVAFDNVQQSYVPGDNGAVVGSDISSLFGLGICPGNKFCADTLCSEGCINLPNVQVFDSTALKTTSATWRTPPGDSGEQLVYTKYTVTTVNNSTLGITAGTVGTLHAFTCVWVDANTEPLNENNINDFTAYSEMLQFINSSLAAKKGEGLQYLQTAFGLE